MDEKSTMSFLHSLKWEKFDQSHVNGAPAQQGVYFIARGDQDRVLYVGCSDAGENIKARLTAHVTEKSNLKELIQNYGKQNPNAGLRFAYLPFRGASDPRAGEDFFLELLGGRDKVEWNRAGTAHRVRSRIMNYQNLSACPCCGRPW